jgi:transcription initiation factor TFIID subunit 8
MDTARRRALNASVAALCIEAGYLSSDRGAIELLTQILQSYICEIGRTSRAYSDSAHRSDPSVCDIELALIDLGAKYSKLDDYSRRPHRRHVPRQVRNYPHPQNKLLQVGTKKQRPAHIPPHLPPFPDNHTYVKTATYQLPHMDYKTIREKLAEQRSQSRQCFSKYLAKTCPSASIAGEIDTNGLYTGRLIHGMIIVKWCSK